MLSDIGVKSVSKSVESLDVAGIAVYIDSVHG